MQNFAQARKIDHLIHFTRLRNIPSIMANGLLGRETLACKGLEATVNDQFRYDYIPDAICCSISFPNYKMFYRLRCDNPNDDWAVIRLKSEVLWTKRCVFCVDNAAKKEISEVDPSRRMGLAAMGAMFEDLDGMPKRQDLKIPDHYSTNPQAEVLVLEPIETKLIVDILVDSKDRIKDMPVLLNTIQPYLNSLKFLHGKHYFDARSDYAHWK